LIGPVGPLKIMLAAGLTGGAVLAAAELVSSPPAPPEPTVMLYSLAAAVIGLVAKAITQKPRSSLDLVTKLENLAHGVETTRAEAGLFRGEITGRIDRIGNKVDALTAAISHFRESTVGALADHAARIGTVERVCERRQIERETR
jgi:flagellin-like hook-associated protein FlgL